MWGFFTVFFLFSLKEQTTYMSSHLSQRSKVALACWQPLEMAKENFGVHLAIQPTVHQCTWGQMTYEPLMFLYCLLSFLWPAFQLQRTAYMSSHSSQCSQQASLLLNVFLLTKRNDSTIFAIVGTHSSRPFAMHLANWWISLLKLLSSLSFLTEVVFSSWPHSIISHLFHDIQVPLFQFIYNHASFSLKSHVLYCIAAKYENISPYNKTII